MNENNKMWRDFKKNQRCFKDSLAKKCKDQFPKMIHKCMENGIFLEKKTEYHYQLRSMNNNRIVNYYPSTRKVNSQNWDCGVLWAKSINWLVDIAILKRMGK